MPRTARQYRVCEICGLRASRKDNEKRLFMSRFPLNEDRCKIWVQQVGKEDLVHLPIEKLHEERHVCGDHFEMRDFGKTRKRLKKRAFPKLHLSAPPLSDDQMRAFPLHVASKQGKGSAKTVEGLLKGDAHNDHTYVVTKKINTAPDDLVPSQHTETTVGVLDGVVAGDAVVDKFTADDFTADDFAADDFAADDVPDHHDPSPVQKVQDSAEKSLFSWQKTELIEADDPEEAPSPPPADPTLAMYCDPDPASTEDHTVPTAAPAEQEVENRCKDCAEVNEGFEFWCVQCAARALCGACAARAPHHAHHVLRAPMASDRTRTQAVLAVIRQQLQNENLLSPHETVADGLKVEVKEEPIENPPAEAEPAEPDPLACEPPARGAVADEQQCVTEQTVYRHEPLKLPLHTEATNKENFPFYIQRKLFKVSPAQAKRSFLIHLEKVVAKQQVKRPQTTSQASKEYSVTQPREYQGPENTSQTVGNQPSKPREYQGPENTSQTVGNQPSKPREYQGPKNTSQTVGNFTGITRENQARTQAPITVTSEPQRSETVIIHLEDDETVEYLEEGFDSDIETVEEVVLDDSETNEDDNETNTDGNRVANEDDDGGDDRDDNVLDEDYLVDPDDFSEDDESDDESVTRKGVKRKNDAMQTSPMRGPSKSIIQEEDLVEYVLSDVDPLVNVAGRGVKRKKDAEDTAPVRGPLDSMVRNLPAKAVVQVRPLSSLEIRNWIAEKRHRK